VSVASWKPAPLAWAKRSGVRNQILFVAASMNPISAYSSSPATPLSSTAVSPIASPASIAATTTKRSRAPLAAASVVAAPARPSAPRASAGRVDRQVRGGQHLAGGAAAVAEEPVGMSIGSA
jgi:hypothetical protein